MKDTMTLEQSIAIRKKLVDAMIDFHEKGDDKAASEMMNVIGTFNRRCDKLGY